MKTKNDTLYDFSRSALMASVPAVFVLFGFLIFSFVPVMTELSVNRQTYKMLLLSQDMFDYGFYIVLLASGFCMSIMQYSFLNKKSSSNVILSFGFKRRTLFLNRLLSALCLMLISTALPLTLTLFANIRYIGAGSYTLKAYLLFVLSTFAVMLIGYSFGLLGAVISGTIYEALATGGALLFFPYVTIYYIYTCMCVLLKGYYYSPLSTGTYALRSVSFLNPLNIIAIQDNGIDNSYKTIWSVRSSIKASEFVSNKSYAQEVQSFSPNEYLLFIGWILICAVLIFASYRFFAKRKAETCGLFKSSKPVAVILISFALIFSAFSGIASGYEFMQAKNLLSLEGNVIYKLLIVFYSLLIIIIAYVICACVYKSSVKKVKPVLKFLPVSAILLVPAVCCIAGGFGFSERIPPAGEIKNIALTIPVRPDTSGVMYGDMMHLISADDFLYNGFESDYEKDAVTELHKQLINNDKSEGSSYYSIKIAYNLNDGSQIIRKYNYLPDDLVIKSNELYNCKTVKNYLYTQIIGKLPQSETDYYRHNSSPYYVLLNNSRMTLDLYWLNYGWGNVMLRPNYSFKSIDITSKLSEERFDIMLKAIAQDLTALSAAELYTPNEPPICVISLNNKNMQNVVGYSWTAEFPNDYAYCFYIFSSMKNTVAFLKSIGVYDDIQSTEEIKEIDLYKCDYRQMFIQYSYKVKIHETNNQSNYPPFDTLSIKDSVPFKKITDTEEINSIKNKLFPYYFPVGQDLSFAVVTYADGLQSMFVIKN